MEYRTIYQADSHRNNENKRITFEIEGKDKLCTPVPLSCHVEDEKLGVWLKVGGGHMLIDPIDLFNTIFGVEERIYVYDCEKEGKMEKMEFFVDIIKEPYMYSLSIGSPIVGIYQRSYHRQDEFISTIKKVLTEFYAQWLQGSAVHYDSFHVKEDALKMCMAQFKIKASFPSYYTLMTKDIQPEKFIFKPSDPSDTEKYMIGIGDRKYSTFLTVWDNDYERIRYQLEGFVYKQEATLELSFDLSNTVIKLRQDGILDEVKESGEGHSFSYKDYVHVEIQPNTFVKMPVIRGYCDVHDTIETLYTGFLQMALEHPEEPDPYVSETGWLAAYNQFKSPIIEHFLDNERKKDRTSYDTRQVHIKDVLTMRPDYDYYLSSRKRCGGDWDYEYLEELCEKQVQIDGLKEWCEEIVPVVIEGAVGREYQKDWKEYHQRGLELAKKLREVLPKEYDLWYEAPIEDKSGTLHKKILIF